MRKNRSPRRPDHDELYRIAEPQGGYFRSGQAARAGFSRKLLWHHHQKTGKFLRVAHGIYRLAQFPASGYEDLFVAWLKCGPKSAISHDSALALYDLSDVLPGRVHVTVPRTASRRRDGIRMHTNRLGSGDVVNREGLPVTSVARTIADVARAGLSEDQVARAVRDALRRGLSTREALLSEARRRGGRPARLIRLYANVEKGDW